MEQTAIAEVVEHFRPLGFFAGQRRAPAAIARDLAAAEDPWTGPLASHEVGADEPRCFSDLCVLKHDPSRVWRLESWEILFQASAKEQGYAYCRDYGEVMKRLTRLCAHRFRLSGKAVSRGSMKVRFERATRPITFRTDGGAFSPGFLGAVNEVIAPSGQELAFVTSRFCTGFILLLSKEERVRLRVDRGWEFCPLR